MIKNNYKKYIGFFFLSFFSSYTTSVMFFLEKDYIDFGNIMDFSGGAPDQYRVLPYLLIKSIVYVLPLKISYLESIKFSVIIFNTFFLFMSFYILTKFIRLSDYKMTLIFIGFSLFYPISMFLGPRPVTALYFFLISLYLFLYDKNNKLTVFLLFVYIAISFSRPDLSIVVLVSTIFNMEKKYGFSIILFLFSIPVISHLIISQLIFPDAVYYCKKIMFYDNLSLSYMVHTPGVYLVAAILFLYYSFIKEMVIETFYEYKFFYIGVIFYFLVILVVGRINELRLYLPLIPMMLYFFSKHYYFHAKE